MKKMLPTRTLLALVLMICALAVRLPARGGGPPAPVPTQQPGSCATMPAGLVGCWTGDGTPVDSSGALGGSWDGTTTYKPGVFGDALSFDGWSSVIVPDRPSLQVTSAFTLSAWINPNASNQDPWSGGIISKLGNGGGNYGYAMGISSGNQVVYVAFNAPGQPWPGNHVTVTLPARLPIGQWAHVAATFDGQDLTLFLNGAVIGTNHTGPTTVATSNNRLRISGDDNNNVRFLGLIDEAAVFSRALSPLEVAALAQLPLSISAPTRLSNTALNQLYTQTVMAAGGVAPYFFSLQSGSLPAGLSLSGDGVISGTTAMPGTYDFTVRVDDSAAHTNEQAYSITVLAPGVAPQISVTSDGRLGQASRYFFDNYAVNYFINTDNGVIYQQYSNYPWEPYANQPESRTVSQPNGSDIRVLEFTTFDVNLGNSQLTIMGSKPLIIATQGDVSIRGNIRVLNNGGVGGVRPEGNYDLGISGSSTPGSIFANAGAGGWGAAFVFSTTHTSWGWDIMTAASGGGGGSATMGPNGAGAHTMYGSGVPAHDPPYPVPGESGAGGQASTADVLQGGGGGGQGGYAHTWYCCYTGGNGANGGGALMFQSGGNVLINTNSSIVADGLATPYYQGEVGGGGAGGGGYLLFDAAGTFENRGILSARGGAGTTYTTVQTGTPGAGGRVVIRRATAAANTGIIDVNGGNESALLGGEFVPSGIPVGGTIKGVGTNVLVGALTATGSNVVTSFTAGTVTFPMVSAMGSTNITPIDAAVARTGGSLPLHYTDTGLAFDVATTATYTAPVTSCFFAPSIATQALFNRLRVLHLENGAYVDRTILAPNQPAPSFATRTICSSTPSLSPFILALIDEAPNQQRWIADYNLDYLGVRTSGDQFLNVPYQFQYGWHIGIFNDNIAPLNDAAITVTPALGAITAVTPTDSLVTPPFSWTRQLGLGGWYSVDLGGGINVPALTPLGYDVNRQLVGGRTIAAGATENRTFVLAFTTHDPALTQIGASIEFNGSWSNVTMPVTASNISCVGPGVNQIQVPDHQIHWQVGDINAMPAIENETTYTLTCTVTLTNASASPVSYTPAIVAEGQIRFPQVETANPTIYTSANTLFGPADPLGAVTYSATNAGTLVHFDQRFQRTVIFDGDNRELDAIAPVTVLTAPPTGNGWYNTASVNVNLSATDTAPSSGIKRLTYSLTGAQTQAATTINGQVATVAITAEGTTTITVQAEDNAGNIEAPHSFDVNIDRTAPAVTLTAPASMLEGELITLSAAATDASNSLAYQWTAPANGGQFTPNGATATYIRRQPGSVTASVKVFDGRGNVTTRSVTIQVNNVTPTVAVPAGGSVLVGELVAAPASFSDPGNDGPWVAHVSYGDGSPIELLPITMNPDARSGAFTLAHAFAAPGDFIVTVGVTDNFGATGTNVIPVHVEAPDTTAPVLSVQDLTVIATDPGGIAVDYTVTATDDRGAATVACSPTSGSVFVIGVTTVNCTATDEAGNSATATFTVTVRDGVAPAITAPTVATVEATSAAGATVTFEPTATDNVGVTSVTCLPVSGSTFAIGTTTVNCAALDAEGNTATATFNVTVEDTTSPSLNVPTIVTATATSGTTAVVNYTATASDVVDGAIAPVCAPASGTTFALGSTLVTCTAADAHGNTATATFTVKVNDGVSPTVTVAPAGDRTVEATSAAGAVVTFTATANDNVDTALATTCAPASGSTFPLGPTAVTCSATDAAGNTGTATFTVTVVDTTAPQLTLPASISTTTTLSTGAAVTYTATASDLVDGARAVTCSPASGAVFAVGQTTVTCTAADTRGNIATGTFRVTVNLNDGNLGRFVALSKDGTWLRQGVRVVSGDVGAANHRADQHSGGDDDSDRDDVTVRFNEGVTMLEAGSRVVGDAVLLMNKVSVFDVLENTLINKGASIRGSISSPLALPFVAMPALASVTPGTVAVDVKKGKTLVLAAGQWGTVHVGQGATLVLSGGLYQVQSLDVDPQGVVLFRGATELRIKGELSASEKAKLVLDQRVAGLKASQMVIYVEGADAVCAHDGRDEDGKDTGHSAVHFGEQNVVQANVYAPNSTIWMKAKTQATGSFIAAHVRIGQGVTLTLDSSWR